MSLPIKRPVPEQVLPDLESLRCFEKAAVLLNFRQAAAAVALSPAALSTRIQRLEEQIGTPLFTRTTRTVTLTAAGVRLLDQARRALHEARGCISLDEGGDSTPYELTVGTRFELGVTWLTPALSTLRESQPLRRLDLYFADSEDLLRHLRQGTIDCAISSQRLTAHRLRCVPLHREEYAFVGTPELLAQRAFRDPVDAQMHTLLDMHSDLPLFRYLTDAFPPGERWSFHSTEHLGTIGAIRYRVLEGAGLAVLPRYFIEADLSRGALVEPMPGLALPTDCFRLIWRAGHPHEEQIRTLADELRELPLR